MDEDKAEILGLLDRIRKTVERETADPGRTYDETDPVVLLVKAEDVIESLAIRAGILHGPRTVAREAMVRAAAERAVAAVAAPPGLPRTLQPPPIPAAVHDALERLWNSVVTYNRSLDDPHGDGTGNDAVAPDGSDYNDLLSMVLGVLSAVLGKPNPLAQKAAE